MTRRLLLFLVLLTVTPALGQTVAGYVQTSQGEVVTGARVTLFDADTTFFREVRSASDGAYEIPAVPAGAYVLGASAEGLAYFESPLTVAAGGATLDVSLGPETEPGRWDLLGDPGEELGGTDSGVLLADGSLLWCHDTIDPVRFDPVTGALTRPASSPRLQGCPAVSVLPDGRVLYVGGHETPVYGPGTRQVKTYNPVADAWTVQPEILDYRWYPTMAPLPDGRFVVAGGGGLDNPVRVRSTEVFDPATMTSVPAGDLALGNEVSPVVLLFTGEVLMTHRPPQLFNPGTRQWRLTADFVQGPRTPNGDHADHELVMMPDGEVVAIGYKSFTPGQPGNLVEIYDPVANAWRLGANRAPVRSRASLALLPDGQILVLGGFKEDAADPTPTNSWGQMALTELYDAEADAWRRVADLNVAREYHVLPILVPDGRVVVVGGEGEPGKEPNESVIEAFSPPYLFRGVRPRISGLDPTPLSRGETITFQIERTADPTRIILVGASANTHFMESGPGRMIALEFTHSAGAVTAVLPSNPAVLIPGHYLLFVLVDDVPSAGQIVQVSREETIGIKEPATPFASLILTAAPNPMRDTATLTFTLPRAGHVVLTLYDARGAVAQRLLAGEREAGIHHVPLDGIGLSSGVYFARLTFERRAVMTPVARVR